MSHTATKQQIESLIQLKAMPTVVALNLASKLIDYASIDTAIRLNPDLDSLTLSLIQKLELLVVRLENQQDDDV